MGRQLGALQRQGILKDPPRLLRVLLVHVAQGLSLAETAVRMEEAGWGRVSAVALWKRLRSSEQWLGVLAHAIFQRQGFVPSPAFGRILAVDATVVREPGATGSLWRVHWMVDLANLQCQHYELTEAHSGETLCRFPLRPGDVVLADRGYSKASGIACVVEQQAHIVVRVNTGSLVLYSAPGKALGLMSRLRRLRPGQATQWPTWVRAPSGAWIAGRLVVRRLSRHRAQIAQDRLRWQAQQRAFKLTSRRVELAKYQLIWTTLDVAHHSYRQILQLYRLRWQIELVFKRMKSILGLGHLPKHSDPAARAWLHAKLLVVLLVERLWERAQRPGLWGPCLQLRCSRWRETQYLFRVFVASLLPVGSLVETLRHWNRIARRLAETARGRTRQHP